MLVLLQLLLVRLLGSLCLFVVLVLVATRKCGPHLANRGKDLGHAKVRVILHNLWADGVNEQHISIQGPLRRIGVLFERLLGLLHLPLFYGLLMFFIVRRLLVLGHCDRILCLSLVSFVDKRDFVSIRKFLPHLAELLCSINHRVFRVSLNDRTTFLGRP